MRFYCTYVHGNKDFCATFSETFGEAVVSGLKEFADRIADPTDPRWTAAQQSADPFRQGNYRPAHLPLTTSPEQRPEWEKSTSIASKSRENLQQRSHVVTGNP